MKVNILITRKQWFSIQEELPSVKNYITNLEEKASPGEKPVYDVAFAIPLDDYELFVEACHSRSIVIGPA